MAITRPAPLPPTQPVIFLQPHGGEVNPRQLRDGTSPPYLSVFFLFFLMCLMFSNVNLRFLHVYTPPPKHLYLPPPQFQIPRNNNAHSRRDVSWIGPASIQQR